MKTLVVLLCLGVISHSAIAQDDDALIEAAQTGIRQALRDPDSAKFSGLYVSTTSNGKQIVCGQVNAKNGFGGYAGTARFWYLDSTLSSIEGTPGTERTFPLVFNQHCRR